MRNISTGRSDADFSLDQEKFSSMVEEIRKAEKVLGKVIYEVSEKDKLRRRSLFVVMDIEKGERFTKENVRSVRPGHGLHPKYYAEILGKGSKEDINKRQPIKKDGLI